MIISDTPAWPFSKISIDFVGSKEPTSARNQYILTIQDNFSKYCVLVPVRQATAEEVTRALTEKLICYFGSPVTLISDQGPDFMNRRLEEFALILKINKFSTTAYHPQSNGGIERMHHTLNEYLKFYLKKSTDWDSLLLLAQHAYNTTVHEGSGYTPHEIVFGLSARTPSSFPPREHLLTYNEYMADAAQSFTQLRTLAAMNLKQSKYKSKFYYDQRQNIRHFREGEMVYVLKKHKHGKTDQEYMGPCEILDVNYGTHSGEIKREEHMRIVHVDMIKRSFELPKPTLESVEAPQDADATLLYAIQNQTNRVWNGQKLPIAETFLQTFPRPSDAASQTCSAALGRRFTNLFRGPRTPLHKPFPRPSDAASKIFRGPRTPLQIT